MELFDSLYMENAPLMVRFLYRWFGSRQLAEEQTQEAFDVLLERWGELDNHPNLSGWLWKTLESLPRDRQANGLSDPGLEALMGELRTMQERDFRLKLIVEQLDGPRFDAVKSLGAFHWRHASFFNEHPPAALTTPDPVELSPPMPEETEQSMEPDVEVLEEKTPPTHPTRPRWIRTGVLALAAVLALAVVAIGSINLMASWEKSHWKEEEGFMVGKFESFAQTLSVNGITLPMAPTLVPPPGEFFGLLSLECSSQRFEGYDLFTAQYRDESGKGYCVKITRSDYPTVMNPTGASVTGAKEYVCDGIAYYVIPNDDGTYHVSWGRAGLSGYIDGNLDQDTAIALARSITRTPEGRILGKPERSPVLVYDNLKKMLSANRLDIKLAPGWLPEDLETVDRFVTNAGDDTDVTMVHSEYQGTGDRMLVLQIEWWENPTRPLPPAFQWEGSSYRVEEHGGIEYTILSDGYAQVVAWRKGHLSAWLYGTVAEEELWKIVDSISQWDAHRPTTTQMDDSTMGVQAWPTLNEAVESLGLDTNLVPTWLPEDFHVEEVESRQTIDSLTIHATYQKDNLVLNMGFIRYENEQAAARSTVGKDTLVPIVTYEHNGFIYYIIGYGDFRTIQWKNGMLEGYITGPIGASQVYSIINSISAKM